MIDLLNYRELSLPWTLYASSFIEKFLLPEILKIIGMFLDVLYFLLLCKQDLLLYIQIHHFCYIGKSFFFYDMNLVGGDSKKKNICIEKCTKHKCIAQYIFTNSVQPFNQNSEKETKGFFVLLTYPKSNQYPNFQQIITAYFELK
jgi:hypothetical protein